ncbi:MULTISPECIES: glycosyltransferase family 4 protein [Pseudomonadota]|jgi:glycosyltransferase involved in cell wall biosynthesis|uniref:glycosyltransferase family 4 protein n=1 Tax=Pseudomonadota TaxID=1224 RepID=UPI001F1101DA|nr:glycosyltransferase family 4 protein [Achromobacter xylosoxidans]MCH4578064.1 glycosyltransferase family 4 protein [Achromobacter xylosoxidans]
MNRPLRILHTEAAKGMGGQEIYIYRHMQVMRARGHEVSLLCQPDARLATLARDDGFTVHTLRMGGLARLLRGICSVSQLVRREQYDVVNTTSHRDALIASAGARLGRTPLVVRSRHLMSPINSLLTYTGFPHRVITVSNFVKQLLIDRGIAADHIGIVPPMAMAPQWGAAAQVDPWQHLQDARARVRTELGFSEREIVIGCVAVLRAAKGHAELVRAIAPLCKANPDLHLVVVGDGQPVMERLQALCAELGLQQQVHLLGFRRDAHLLMTGFDIFALTPYKEAAGTVFLEAAWAALPIVSHRVGGVPEMLVEGSNAILTHLGDDAALTGALRLLVDDPERRRQMGRAGWDWMRTAHRFSPDGHGEATEHYYYQWLRELGHG